MDTDPVLRLACRVASMRLLLQLLWAMYLKEEIKGSDVWMEKWREDLLNKVDTPEDPEDPEDVEISKILREELKEDLNAIINTVRRANMASSLNTASILREAERILRILRPII